MAPTATSRWFAERNSANNAWNFNNTNGTLNNNNVNNSNRCQAVTNLLKRIFRFMIREEELFNIMLRFMLSTRRNKRYGRDSMSFERAWAPRLLRMMRGLLGKTFRITENYAFLTSVPRWREVFATMFEGRIADHIVCDTLSPFIEKVLHPRTFNNRIGKGSQAAINQVIEDIEALDLAAKTPEDEPWVVKWDLKGFFPNADCDFMEKCFLSVIDGHEDEISRMYGSDAPGFLKWLVMVCVHSYPADHCEFRSPRHLWKQHIPPAKSIIGKPSGKGAPIGRLSSQVAMGLYINPEVIWLNEVCGIRTTVFMDDGVMVFPKRVLPIVLATMPELRRRFAAKGVMMNERKFYCQPARNGLEFLGTHIRGNRLILNDSTFLRGMCRINEHNGLGIDDKYKSIDGFISTVNSYTGLLKNRTSWKRLNEIRTSIHPDWWTWMEWDGERKCIVCREGFRLRDRLNVKYNLKLKDNDKRRKTSAHQRAVEPAA